MASPVLSALFAAVSLLLSQSAAQNVSTFTNPIIPGFHPDPTCTFVPELNSTFFCTFSSFLTFPGLPIVASRDLVNWKHISNALSRPEQLPALAFLPRGATSGIYAPTLRYRDGTFYILSTLANQALYPTNYTKWDNFIVTSTDPYTSSSWSNPIHFDFPGIDPSPFWDDDGDGQAHIQGSIDGKSILQTQIDLKTGEITGPLVAIWNGTGLPSPEAPHMYKKDGWYYLLTAEGGTRERHRANMARSRNLYGPYEGAPANPLLSGYLTQSYFQAVGHADIFPDSQGNFWAIALAVRAAYSYNFDPYNSIFPMGPATLPAQGEGYSPSGDDSINFEPGSKLPPHLFHWRLPVIKNYAISPAGDGNFDRTNSLMLRSSVLNLTAYDADSTRGRGQTFLARKQAHSRFRYSVDVSWAGLTRLENEVGVSALQDQAQHFDLGIVMLPSSQNRTDLEPHLRFRGISTSTYRLPERFKYVDKATPFSSAMKDASKLRLQIEALNTTHYAFSAGCVNNEDADADVEMAVFGYAKGQNLIPYYSGVVVGVYATSNGKYGEGAFTTYVSRWRYTGLEQISEFPEAQGPVVWD
ncbi:glycoside hydrolase family 43 protein [Periconia macrospinosa]|uniref:Glycoside hydrolase family 43 protein n=1 Tax=Periconia macrospinosa TaxID=97972 RepID=A0A2V1DMG3_9PLEO|nr:glycoside hydrolase family 43 protein [Periconia macrospinosa]